MERIGLVAVHDPPEHQRMGRVVDGVVAAAAVPTNVHYPCHAQFAQVLTGYGGSDASCLGQIADGMLVIGDEDEDL